GNAVNVKSMMRWDANKRRAYASIAAPLRGNPKWGFYAAVDARRENWTGPGGAFQMRKTEAAAQIRSIPNGHWKWTSGFSVSDRRLRAHSATLDGLKNATFMNRSFVLTNLDLQKTVFQTGFFRLSAGPFLDAARLTNISHSLFDTGLQLRLAALGLLTLNLSYGRSLRDGGSAFFTDITR